jgi:hypothetical protein
MPGRRDPDTRGIELRQTRPLQAVARGDVQRWLAVDEPHARQQPELDESSQPPVGHGAADANARHHVLRAHCPHGRDPRHDRTVPIGYHAPLPLMIYNAFRAS